MLYKLNMKLLTTAFLAVLSVTIVHAGQLGSRMQSVEKLLQTSSAAQQIKGSDNHAAKDKHSQAVNLYQQARQADSSGNEQQAADLLKQATMTMFEATRMIEKDASFLAKDLRDFESRKQSVQALCTAYENIAKEKGMTSKEEDELHAFVHQRVDRAVALKDDNRVKEGRKMLDEAYVAAKVAIEHIRGGETLVRSLNFANSEEEYHYEIDRNDTHRMLVDVLLKEKIEQNNSARAMVDKFLGKADELRKQADSQASDGEYENAVTTLEQSTKEIVRAIRSAGIYIPG
ncbi:MAG: hypothetical protein JSW45_05015 [Thiotrichales bacterium]|nr:MAG: hypothetical protein JSW45_05015 [Thiotrichales bacterium]